MFIFVITGEEQPFAISAVLAVLIGLVAALVILAIIIIFIVKSRSSGDNAGKLIFIYFNEILKHKYCRI